MMLVLVLYPIFDLIICRCLCFHLNIDNPIIYLDQAKYLKIPQSEKSSYFGYSVILFPSHIQNQSWVQIGAPRGNSPGSPYNNTGVVFRCKIGERCERLEVDEGEDEGIIVSKNAEKYHYKMDDAWLGGAMDIDFNSNRSVVCAPRWTHVYTYGNNKRDYRLNGACYWSQSNSVELHGRLPLLGRTSSYNKIYYYGQAQSGFAVHMPKLGDEMLIGAPGVFNWKGTSILLTNKSSESIPAESIISESDPNGHESELFDQFNVIDVEHSGRLLAFSLFGYAVSSGRFFDKTLYYVSTAPRSAKYKGQVYIHKFNRESRTIITGAKSKAGTQFGEYFGASVAVGDINNDGLDDLFVGAPFCKTSKYNEGRMYLFLGSKKGVLQEPSQGKFVDGTQPNGQLGTAITFLGTMGKAPSGNEHCIFVAVAAPYEDTSGVVYIFRGTADGMNTVPIQRIVGWRFFPDLRGFGISISKPADIDANGYKDIAIGAHESGQVVVVRSSPLVKLNTYFRDIPDNILPRFSSFNATLCHQYTSNKGQFLFRMERIIEVDTNMNRVHLDHNTKSLDEIPLAAASEPFCESITIIRNKSLVNFSPITIRVTHIRTEETKPGRVIVSSRPDGVDRFCKDCGVYDDLDPEEPVVAHIPFYLGCGADNCVSEIEFESSFRGVGVSDNAFILGAANNISIDTVVKNKGEKAYSLKVQVDFPLFSRPLYKTIPPLCAKVNSGLICDVADPLSENETANFSIELDMNRKFDGNFLIVNVTILTISQNKNKNFRLVQLNLTSEADITIAGNSGEQSYSYGNATAKKVPFQQIYQISKYDRSTVYEMTFKIRIPYAIKTKTGNITFLSLFEPKESFTDAKSIKFESNIPYKQENRIEEDIEPENNLERRKRREVVAAQTEQITSGVSSRNITKNQNGEMKDFLLEKQTFEINCNMDNIICGEVTGWAGPFEGQKSDAIFVLKMILDIEVLEAKITEEWIRYTTVGEVVSKDPALLIQSGKRPDKIDVSSLFKNDRSEKRIALWIIISSIALGLLLLLFLIVGLAKVGFFRRTKKEELKNLKAQAEAKSEDPIVTENVEEEE